MSHVEIAQRSTRGSFALFAGNLLSTLFSFVAIIFIARLLGPSDYGVYTICVLVPSILLNFLGFGVNSGITRYAALNLSQDRPEVARRMTLNGASFVLVFGVALSAVQYVAAGFIAEEVFHRPDIAPMLRFSSIFIIAQAVFQSGVSALLGWSYMGKMAGVSIVQGALRLAVVLPLLYLGYEVYGALVAYAVSVVLAGVLAYLLLWRDMGTTTPLRGQFVSDVRTLLSYSGELFVGTFVTNMSAQFVVVLLAVIASNAYVGFYQSASNFVTIVTLVSSAITQALFPAFAHLDGAKADVGRAFRYATKYMGFAITPIIFLLMGASVQIIRLPLGSSYASASSYLTLLSFSYIPILFGLGVLPSFFNGVGRPRFYMLFSIAGAGVLFGLAPLLAVGAGLGVDGLILSILVSNLVAVVTGMYLASRFLDAGVDIPACLSILVSSVLAYIVTLAASTIIVPDFILLPAEILVFSAVYLTAAPLLHAIESEDLDILRSAVSGLGRFRVLIVPILRYEEFVLRACKPRRV